MGRSNLSNTRSEASWNANDNIPITGMGYTLVANLMQYGAKFSGKIHISGLGSFNLFGISQRLATPYTYSSLAMQHSSTSTKGVSNLFLPRKADFRFPDFSNIPQMAPQNWKMLFETIIASPPRRPITYYVGPPLAPDFNTLLNPGKLLELGELPGEV